ncbi:ATP-binding cassette sub-family G member 5-like [Protopterus annectens]|uniref:ATP-binding cassette sub-family G member 5-like n=1 Tax=Protopterus annectens TaxID=7888 RepID=UPI001CFBEF55|nr:ATP-binding cassette sub-family G member 5-like [Protopterus annectens]
MSHGELIFCGESEEMVTFFSDCGYACPEYSNPFDYYVDLTSVDTRSKERELETYGRIHVLVDAYQNTEIWKNMLDKINEYGTKIPSQATPFRNKDSPATICKLGILLRRTVRNLSRNRIGIIMRLFQNVFFALFMAFFLMRLSNDVLKGAIQDRLGLLFQSIGAPAYLGALNAVALFPALRAVSDQESEDGLYQKWHMMLAYKIHIIPFSTLSMLFFGGFLYWAVGLYPDVLRFLTYFAVLLIFHFIGEYLAVALLGLVRNPNIVNSVAALIIVAGVLLGSGFLRTTEDMPTVFLWLSYLTFQKYGTEILVINEFYGKTFTCGNFNSTTNNPNCAFAQGINFIDKLYPGAPSRFTIDFVVLSVFVPLIVIIGIINFKIRDFIIRR